MLVLALTTPGDARELALAALPDMPVIDWTTAGVALLLADATGVGTGSPSVRAERDGSNDGRVYHIAFTATGAGGSCTGSVTVGVPKSQGNNGGPVDQGALYNSTLP